MTETVTLEFIAKQLDRLIADHAATRDDIHVLTAIVLRHENTLNHINEQLHDMLRQISAMVAQQARFNDRLRRLEDQPAE
jgi:hypothetical protein